MISIIVGGACFAVIIGLVVSVVRDVVRADREADRRDRLFESAKLETPPYPDHDGHYSRHTSEPTRWTTVAELTRENRLGLVDESGR